MPYSVSDCFAAITAYGIIFLVINNYKEFVVIKRMPKESRFFSRLWAAYSLYAGMAFALLAIWFLTVKIIMVIIKSELFGSQLTMPAFQEALIGALALLLLYLSIGRTFSLFVVEIYNKNNVKPGNAVFVIYLSSLAFLETNNLVFAVFWLVAWTQIMVALSFGSAKARNRKLLLFATDVLPFLALLFLINRYWVPFLSIDIISPLTFLSPW